MGHLFEQLSSNPLYLTIAVLLAVVLVVGIVKKLMKIIVIMAIVLIAFAGYLQFTGRDVPTNVDDLKDSISNQVDKVKDSANQAIEDAL